MRWAFPLDSRQIVSILGGNPLWESAGLSSSSLRLEFLYSDSRSSHPVRVAQYNPLFSYQVRPKSYRASQTSLSRCSHSERKSSG
jgi:hypothetical protein